MRSLILAALLMVPIAAKAQQLPAEPAAQALGQMVVEAAQREAVARTQLIAAQAKIAELEAAAKAASQSSSAAPTPQK